MRKFILLLLVSLYSVNLFAENDRIQYTADSIQNEIKNFIKFNKKHSIKNGYYDVYIVKIFADNENNEDYSYTLGLIYNWFDIKYISFNYYYELDSEIVLIAVQKDLPKAFKDLNIVPLDTANAKKAYNKLYPQEQGGITGFAQGKVISVTRDKIEKAFYDNEDNIPANRSIYDYRPSMKGIIQISEPIKWYDSLKRKGNTGNAPKVWDSLGSGK